MSEARTCSECGTPLNHDAPEGFCPACMLEGALRIGHSALSPSLSHPMGEGGRRPGEGAPFGDYQLLNEIARGGMGVVYRARQISLNRIVAVKLILIGQFADRSTVRRFKAEAAAAAKLRHPNIVAIHEIGEEAGQHFFSMDYVEGANLADFIRKQPISIRQTAQLLKTIAEALHYAHEQGIVHRDLKPSNILIDGLLEPRITDFGLAKDLKVDSDLTLTGQMLGSPNYMSPEQASGKTAVGVPTDIYSLGAILYHLLSGRPPFAAETLTDTLSQVATMEAVSPRLLNPSVPRDLETICLKCLEKEPERRYPSAKVLAEELNRFLDAEPIHARPIGASARVWRWCRRKPVVAGLTVAVALSMVLGFIGVLWQWRRAEHKAHESRRNLYAADMILAQAALEAGNIGRATELLRKYLPRRGEKDLRGWEWRYAWGQCRSDELFTLEGHSTDVMTLALSPDARMLASGSLDRTVMLWDLESKKPITNLVQSDSVYSLAFSKDGKELIAGTSDGTVSFWNCETWQRATVLSDLSLVLSLRVSPDGKLLAVFTRPFLILWDLAERREVVRFERRYSWDLMPGGIAFSPDSALLAYGHGDGTIVLWDLANAKRIAELKGHERFVSALAFSPDGSILVSGSRDRTVRVWDVRSSKELRQLGTFSGWVGGVAFSPQGGLLAVVGAGQGVRLFETRSWEEINTLRGHLGAVWAAVFVPDGQTIVTGSKDGTVKCWSVSANQQSAAQRLPVDINASFLLPDAKRLHLTHTNRTYSLWRTDPLEETERHPVPIPHLTASAVSLDGKFWVGASTNSSRRAHLSRRSDTAAEMKLDGALSVFDRAQEKFIAELPCPGGSFDGFAFSNDGQMLAALGNDHTCRVWRIVSPAVSKSLVGPEHRSAGDDGAPARPNHSSENGFQQIAQFVSSARRVRTIKFLGSGHLLGIGDWEGTTEIWKVGSSHKVARLGGHKWFVSDIVLSRDESTVVTSGADGRVKVWDLRSGREVASLGGQLVSLFSVVFSPDESRLAACGGDGTVRLWDMENKQEVATLKIHNYPLKQLAFSSDDSLVVLDSGLFGEGRVFVLRAPKNSEP